MKALKTLAIMGVLGVTSAALGASLSPAHAAADASNFNVRNCTPARIFVCSFDKTDSSMKIPYKAAGIKPGDRKEFGCASLGRCKVIIGVSEKRKKQSVLSKGMQLAKANKLVAAAVIGVTPEVYVAASSLVAIAIDTATGASLVASTAGGAAVTAVVVGGAIGGIAFVDGLSDGQVCNQVRKAAEKAGMKPRDFAQDGKKYMVIPQYAVDSKGRAYVNGDGTAVFSYKMKKGNTCSAPLKVQLVPN